MKNISFILLAFLASNNAWASDNIFGDPKSGNFQLKDNAGNFWNAYLADTTNGNGDIYTLGGLVAGDNIIGGGSTHLLIDNTGRRWPLSVWYTTDGSGNVIPITGGGGGGGVSSVSGTAPVVSSGGATPAISMAKATSSVDGYLFHTDWSTFNSKQSALSFSSPLLNTSGTVSCNAASGSQPGCLSSVDWSTFNGKQDAGNYITALTGDVSASGPGSSAATVANAAYKRYINFVLGDDSTGTGSDLKPWKTVQHACTAVTGLATINTPFTIYVSGGNNDTDAGAVSCPPNINIISEYPIQITGTSFTITGGITNDSVSFTNLIFIGSFSWVRNDATAMGVQFRNAEFFSGPTVKQNGAGSASITAYDSVTVNADFKTGGTGNFFFNNNFLGANTIFEDANSSAYYQLMGGYNSSNIQVSGGAEIYLSGVQCDAAFGCAMTGATTANGTPIIQTDSGSIPAVVSGAFTTNLISHAQWESYAPALTANWSGAPSTVAAALDKLVVLQQSAVGSQPACSSANRGLQWLVQGGAGVADIYQVCQKNSSDAYVWTTH